MRWKERGIGKEKPVLKISQPVQDSLPRFRLHMDALLNVYGPKVFALDLLCRASNQWLVAEPPLAYEDLVALAQSRDYRLHDELEYIPFDLSSLKATVGIDNIPTDLAERVHGALETIGATKLQLNEQGKVNEEVEKQHGVFRVNCRDCLDRTNLAESIISLLALEHYLRSHSGSFGFAIKEAHRLLFSQVSTGRLVTLCTSEASADCRCPPLRRAAMPSRRSTPDQEP